MQSSLKDMSKSNNMLENYPRISKTTLSYIVSMMSLGFAEYYNLKTLYKISYIMSIITSFLMVVVIVVYVYDYGNRRLRKK